MIFYSLEGVWGNIWAGTFPRASERICQRNYFRVSSFEESVEEIVKIKVKNHQVQMI